MQKYKQFLDVYRRNLIYKQKNEDKLIFLARMHKHV